MAAHMYEPRFLQDFEDFLTCHICLEVLDDPHSLNCSHTFCRSCIKRLIKDNVIKCPSCEKISQPHHVHKSCHTSNLVELLQKQHHSNPPQVPQTGSVAEVRSDQGTRNQQNRHPMRLASQFQHETNQHIPDIQDLQIQELLMHQKQKHELQTPDQVWTQDPNIQKILKNGRHIKEEQVREEQARERHIEERQAYDRYILEMQEQATQTDSRCILRETQAETQADTQAETQADSCSSTSRETQTGSSSMLSDQMETPTALNPTQSLQNTHQKLLAQLTEAQELQRILTEKQDDAIEQARRQTDKCLEDLHEIEAQHAAELKQYYEAQVGTAARLCNQELDNVAEFYQAQLKDLKHVIKKITKLLTSESASEHNVLNLEKKVKRKLKDINRQTMDEFTVDVQKTTSNPFDYNKAPRIIDGATEITDVTNIPGVQLAPDPFKQRWISFKSKLPHMLVDMCIMDDKVVGLWCPDIWKKSGRLSKEAESKLFQLHAFKKSPTRICVDGLGEAVAVAHSNGNLIVASDKGLLQVPQDAKMNAMKPGLYCHCRTTSNGTIYALRVFEIGKPVYVDIIVNEKLARCVRTQINWDGTSVTCAVPAAQPADAQPEDDKPAYIYICSNRAESFCLNEVELNHGRVISRYGSEGPGGPGEFNGPKICNWLDEDNLLLTDRLNHRLQVFNIKTKTWRVFLEFDETIKVYGAIVKGSNLYIGVRRGWIVQGLKVEQLS